MHILLTAPPVLTIKWKRHIPATENTVQTASTAEDALSYLQNDQPDVILIAYNQPDMPALAFLKAIRKLTQAPVIITGATRAACVLPYAETELLFESGADDILPNLLPKLIMPRLRAMVRRYRANAGSSTLQASGITLQMHQPIVEISGKVVNLPPKQHAILQRLMLAKGHTVSREDILYSIGSPDSENRMVDTHVSHLRSKLGIKIECYPKVGYCLPL